MTHPNYPDWNITKRLLVDGYPLLLLEKDNKKIVLSEGVYKLIIEFLLNVSKPHISSFDDVNSIMHQGFASGTGWAISGVFYGHLIQPSEFSEYHSDPEFSTELEQYQKRTGQVLNEPIWHVSVNSGDWRHAKQFMPQSSVQKIIEVESLLFSDSNVLLEGVEITKSMTNAAFSLLIDGYTIDVKFESGQPIFSSRESIVRSYNAKEKDVPIIDFILTQVQNEERFEDFWMHLQKGWRYNLERAQLFQIKPEDFLEYHQLFALHELCERLGDVQEPVWAYQPTWQYDFHCLTHSTVLKMVRLTREILLSQNILLLRDVEVLSEDDWDLRFGWAASTGLRPSLLPRLEACATEYLAALKTGLPTLESARTNLLDELSRAGLLNREFENEAVYYQLKSANCVNLKTCLDNAEYLYGYLISDTRLEDYSLPKEHDIRDLGVSLDWMIHAPDYPSDGHAFTYDFLAAAEQVFLAAKRENIEPIIFESLTIPMRLILVWDDRMIKLGHAERVKPKSLTEGQDLERMFKQAGIDRTAQFFRKKS